MKKKTVRDTRRPSAGHSPSRKTTDAEDAEKLREARRLFAECKPLIFSLFDAYTRHPENRREVRDDMWPKLARWLGIVAG